jgi:two-component system response regulator MtrA
MTETTHHVLLVEDSDPLGRQIVATLENAGYATDWIRHGDVALAAPFEKYALVILDLMLPGADGFCILDALRRRGVQTPVLVASARADSRDKIRALDLGASDYLVKPFWPQELLERVAAQLEPSASAGWDTLEIGGLRIDLDNDRVSVAGDEVSLTPREFAVLVAIARRCGATVSRASVLQRIGDAVNTEDSGTLDACVLRIKQRLGPAGAFIQMVWGIGYRMDV